MKTRRFTYEKRSSYYHSAFLLLGLTLLTSCDPVFPLGNLKVEQIGTIAQGSSADIQIVYPNIGGSIVKDWRDQKAEIIEGDDIVAISGLTVTGLKPGTARIRVSAVTVLIEEAVAEGKEEKEYFAEIVIKVE